MRTLHLTTPEMHGDDVLDLQRALRSAGYLSTSAAVDGVYGTVTAQAVYRAKYWLGYRRPDHSAAQLLLDYLHGTKRPTPTMVAQAAKRKRAQPKVPLRELAYKAMLPHKGQKESPAGSNREPWSSLWYGVVGPWCAMAVTHAYVAAGSKVFSRGRRYAYVPYIVADARRGLNRLTVTKDPEQGDLVCYDWNRDGTADHVGLFNRWISKGSEFEALEGNTGIGNDSNGGEYMIRQRFVRDVQVFVRVGG